MTNKTIENWLENIYKYSEMPTEEISKEMFIGIVAMTIFDSKIIHDGFWDKDLTTDSFSASIFNVHLDEDVYFNFDSGREQCMGKIASEIYYAGNSDFCSYKIKFFEQIELLINPPPTEKIISWVGRLSDKTGGTLKVPINLKEHEIRELVQSEATQRMVLSWETVT